MNDKTAELLTFIFAFIGVGMWIYYMITTPEKWRLGVLPITILANCCLFYICSYFDLLSLAQIYYWDLVIHVSFIFGLVGMVVVYIIGRSKWTTPQ